MPITIPVAHDFICPWCYVAIFQAARLRDEFGVTFDWRGFELFPEELEWPEPAAPVVTPENKPATPTRLEFLLHADGLEMPKTVRPRHMRTHNAHEAAEYAKTEGKGEEFIDVLYRAYWEQGREINKIEVLRELATGVLADLDAMVAAIENRTFYGEIVKFDDDAYAAGIYNVPTYWIGENRYAEQPYVVLAKAVREVISA